MRCRRRWMMWIAVIALPLATTTCLDETKSDGTTPRAGGGVSSSDAPRARVGAPRPSANEARSTNTGSGGGPAVPGLNMRAEGAPPPTSASSAAPRAGGTHHYQNPRTLPSPWIGGRRAKVVIVEFTDLECPFCRHASRTLRKVLTHYGSQVKLVFRHLPLKIHAQSRIAAEAAVCAQAQGRFWKMEELIFEHNRSLSRARLIQFARRLGLDVPQFKKDLDSGACRPRVEADIAEARRRKLDGTPTFFINGAKHDGALSYARFRQLIDAELNP